jgi:PPOX class probable F420-dependent enzyme
MPMSPEEIDAFLGEVQLCHFATVDSAGDVRVRPMWYLWRDGVLWFTTRREVRHTGRDLRSTPLVAVSVASDERPYRAVVARGRVEVLDADLDMLLEIATRYGERQGRAFAEEAMGQHDRVILRMAPESLTSWDYGTTA